MQSQQEKQKHKTNHKTKKQTQQRKNKQPKTSNQPKQQQKQNNQKNTKKWDRNQLWRFMHDILCAIMIMVPNRKQNKETRQKHQRPIQRV